MKSRHSHKFNHDLDAPGYDEDIKKEENPIRTGYQALHEWIGEQIPEGCEIIDLGCGTGNTALSLKGWKSLICVDISEKMLEIARQKLEGKKITFRQKDMISFLYSYYGNIDAIVSAYALHHLEQDEKHALFKLIHENDVKTLVFGDLMFENKEQEKEMRTRYPQLAENFDEEFFWNLEEETSILKGFGYTTQTKQFSDLSWGIRAWK